MTDARIEALEAENVRLREALEEAKQAVDLLETLCSSPADDAYVWGVQAKIDAALSKDGGAA